MCGQGSPIHMPRPAGGSHALLRKADEHHSRRPCGMGTSVRRAAGSSTGWRSVDAVGPLSQAKLLRRLGEGWPLPPAVVAVIYALLPSTRAGAYGGAIPAGGGRRHVGLQGVRAGHPGGAKESGDDAGGVGRPDVCAALEVSADALLGTAQSQDLEALVRGLRGRLASRTEEERTRGRNAAIGHLLLHMADEQVDEWKGEHFLTAGRGREDRRHAATQFTGNGSVVHVRGTSDLADMDVSDQEVSSGLEILADPVGIALLCRLVPDGNEPAQRYVRRRATTGACVPPATAWWRRDTWNSLTTVIG